MTTSLNNPLRQYFRRPAVYLRLPSNGKFYTPGIIDMPDSGELPVFPMTAIDDISIRTPDALFNGTAVTDIIRSCVPNIKDPWKITSVDLDAILVAIRSASGDGKMSVESTCPECKETSDYEIELMYVLAELKSGDYDKLLQINELGIKFRPLTYAEMNQAAMGQFEVQRAFAELEQLEENDQKTQKMREALTKVTELTMEILAQTIEFIATPNTQVTTKEYILDFLRN